MHNFKFKFNSAYIQFQLTTIIHTRYIFIDILYMWFIIYYFITYFFIIKIITIFSFILEIYIYIYPSTSFTLNYVSYKNIFVHSLNLCSSIAKLLINGEYEARGQHTLGNDSARMMHAESAQAFPSWGMPPSGRFMSSCHR